ncbi:transporter [Roseivirga sp. E12]|uniref:transporter n=1 Tax=Roseivirga sp. E12 TaxID=2819237 RepID=UPI001ABC9AE1|nr:transporter [Roseivirga sp. E12]MBO3700537.1 transporter [Roseivirga sp. E12]
MRTSVLVFFFCLLSVSVFAQEDDNSASSIATDRPTQTTSPYVIAPRLFQIETGFYQQQTNQLGVNFPNGVDFKFQNIVYNSLLLRYGISDKLELRLNQEFGRTRELIDDVITEQSDASFGPTTIGVKYQFVEEEGWRPAVALNGHVGGQFLSSGGGITGDLRVNFQNNISDKFNISYNVGIILIENSRNVGLWTLNLGFTVSPKLTVFLEGYGFKDNVSSQQSIDFGLLYLLSPNLQIDFFGGFAMSELAPDSLFGFGISTNIAKRK